MEIRIGILKEGKPEYFAVEISKDNSEIAKEKLKKEHKKIVDILKMLKEEGKIKSIFRPRNKKIQEQLDGLVNLKREIKKALKKISIIF